MSTIKLIKSEEDYESALERLNEIFDAPTNSKKGEEAEILAILINDYEAKNFEIPSPDPIDAIKIRMDEMNLKQKDLIGEIGSKSIVSEVLNKRRRLTTKMIRGLSTRLQLGAELLIKEYQLQT